MPRKNGGGTLIVYKFKIVSHARKYKSEVL